MRPKRCNRLADKARHVAGAGGISSHGEHLGAEFPDVAGRFSPVSSARRAQIATLAPSFGKTQRGRPADTFAAAGDPRQPSPSSSIACTFPP